LREELNLNESKNIFKAAKLKLV